MSPTTKKAPPPQSRRNRDKESLYRPGRLSFWMAVTSVLLLGSWVLMLYRDHARSWKDMQADFYETMIEVEAAREGEVRTSVDRAELERLEKIEKGIRKKNDETGLTAEVAQLREEADALKKDVLASDRDFKSVKGLHAVARYRFEMARLERERAAQEVAEGEATEAEVESLAAEEEERREDLNYYSTRWRETRIRSANLQADYDQLVARIAEKEAPLAAARKAIARAKESITTQASKLEGLKQKYANNPWRNAPFVDFLSPTIKIEQVVLDDIHDNWNFATNSKVDRCMTCHAGIYMPDFSEEALSDLQAQIEERGGDPIEIKEYMLAHPHLDMIVGATSPHKMENVGCTVCHHGVGWATEFSRAVHVPDSLAQKKRWEEEYGYYKAKYIDYPMQLTEYVQGQCHKCHKQGMYYQPHYEERLDHGYVTDDEERGLRAQRLYADPEHPLYADAKQNRVLQPHEVYGDYRLPIAPPPVEGTQEDVAQETRLWLQDHMDENYHDARVPTRNWRAERYEKGYDAIVMYGCQGCHKIADFGQQVGYEEPPRVAPTLTYLRDKVKEEWVDKWIRYPDLYRADTKMPSFYYFALKDAEWNYVEGKDGKPVTLPVMNAHMTNEKFSDAVGNLVKPSDVARMDVEIRALKAYLLNQRDPATGELRSRANKSDAAYDPLYEVEPPPGDVTKGRELVVTIGCVACHIVPEVPENGTVDQNTNWVPDGPERFGFDPLLMRGPRLTSLGSKIRSRSWMNAWLVNPRHYTATTRMPNMWIADSVDPNGNVTRTAEQNRADVIDYLLSHEDEGWDALEETPFRASYQPILRDMYEEFFGKDAEGKVKRPRQVEGEIGDLNDKNRLATVLGMVGERIMTRAGCFGCHEVAGHEADVPIGTELTKEGIKNIHQFDFGRVPKEVTLDVMKLDGDGNPVAGADGQPVMVEKTIPLVPHTRHDFIRTKLTYPRVWDFSKQLRWVDKLRMPLFNYRQDDNLPAGEYSDGIATRGAVTGIVLGQVDEPIKPGALYDPDAYAKDIIAGRRVVQRYGCNNCHTVEGKRGFLWGLRMDLNPNTDAATLPPNLFSQGLRTRSEWLMSFLKEPYKLRPIVGYHMPNFGLSNAEAIALVRYFLRLAGRDQNTLVPQKGSRIAEQTYGAPVTVRNPSTNQDLGAVRDAVDEARLLFETIDCNKCHLPKGSPGADPNDGGVAPSFSLSAERLGHGWVRMLLNNPQHLINGTKMPSVYPAKRGYGRSTDPNYQGFQFELRDDPEWQELFAAPEGSPEHNEALKRLAERQMEALTDYVLYHYVPPAPVSEPPK